MAIYVCLECLKTGKVSMVPKPRTLCNECLDLLKAKYLKKTLENIWSELDQKTILRVDDVLKNGGFEYGLPK